MTDAYAYLFKVLRDVLACEDDGFGARIFSDGYVNTVVERYKFCIEDSKPELCTVLHHIWVDENDWDDNNVKTKQ